LRTQIQRDLGIVVPVIELLDGPSITTLAARLGGRLSGAGTADDPASDPDTVGTPPPQATAPDDSSRWIDLLVSMPEVSDADVDELLREVLATREGQGDG